jgi:multiple sugar transport system permease protein
MKNNRAALRIRRENLLHGPMDMTYLSKRGKSLLLRILFYSVVIGLCFSILYPLLKILPTIFCDFEDLGNPDVVWIPIKTSILSLNIAIRFAFGNGKTMFLTLLYCTTISAIQTFISAFAGYSLGRVSFPFRGLVMALVIVTIIVPPQSLLISQYLRFKQFDILGIITFFRGGPIDLINKPYTLYVLALTGFGVKQSIFVFIFRQFFQGLPNELEEAALIDGCGFYKCFFKIVFPTAVPAVTSVATLAFVWNYGDTYYTGYFHPNGPYLANTLAGIFSPSNVTSVLNAIKYWYSLPEVSNFTFDAIKYAASIIYLAPLLILYLFIQRRLVENFERSGIVG